MYRRTGLGGRGSVERDNSRGKVIFWKEQAIKVSS